jgi:hypothetical protein
MIIPFARPVLLLTICVGVAFSPNFKAAADIQAFCAEGAIPGCDGQCDSQILFDQCGVCGGKNRDKDECGVCFGGNRDKDSCGVCNGGNRDKDRCGVCFGANRDLGCDGVCASAATVDQCGVCNGKNLAKGCDGKCFSGAVDKGCGCGVSDCNKCVWIASWTADILGAVRYPNIIKNGLSPRREPVPSCFEKRFSQSCQPYRSRSAEITLFGMCSAYSGILSSFIGAPRAQGMGNIGTSWYMDEQCKYVANPAGSPVCGAGVVAYSPISLIWEPNYNLSRDSRVVKFNLTGKDDYPFTLWKGSDKAPLLVFDPDHSGKVTSAKQLFGNIAFGGVTSSVMKVGSGEWKDGYAALALLDSDGDGRIAGDELEPISLWFDANRDAQVNSGELKSALSENITALFYKGASQLGTSKDVVLSVGYERSVNGTVTTGSSVDWFSEVFSSEKEAADTLVAIAESFSKEQYVQAAEFEEWMTEPGVFQPNSSDNHQLDIGGYWVWWQKDNEEVSQKHPALFAFHQSSNGVVRGFSVTESPVLENAGGFSTIVRTSPTTGNYTRTSGGESILTFDVLDQFGKPGASSTAKLSNDGLHLEGVTSQTTEYLKDGTPISASVSYAWRATKFVTK